MQRLKLKGFSSHFMNSDVDLASPSRISRLWASKILENIF